MGLPFAFRQGGPAPFSFGITLLMGAICAYTIVLIVKSERKLSSKATNGTDEDPFITKTSEQSPKATRALTFPEIGAAAFPNLSFTLCGARFNAVELLLHVIVQVIVLGVCVAYTDFIAQTLPSLWPDTFDAGLSILLVVPFFICTAMLRSFSVLAITSVIGDVAVMAAFIAVVAYGFASSDYGHLHIPMEPVGHEVVGFVQTATFLFAVHANMLPIAQAMKDPETQFELTLYKTFACIVLVNGVFAFLCYGLFVDDVASPVTLNLGCAPGTIKDNVCGEQAAGASGGITHVVIVGVQVLLCIDRSSLSPSCWLYFLLGVLAEERTS